VTRARTNELGTRMALVPAEAVHRRGPDETMIAIIAPSPEGASSRRGRLAAMMPVNVVS
jgi:hypothetical protein